MSFATLGTVNRCTKFSLKHSLDCSDCIRSPAWLAESPITQPGSAKATAQLLGSAQPAVISSALICKTNLKRKHRTVAKYQSSQQIKVLWRQFLSPMSLREWGSLGTCFVYLLMFLKSSCSHLTSSFITAALSCDWQRMLFTNMLHSLRACFTWLNKIKGRRPRPLRHPTLGEVW